MSQYTWGASMDPSSTSGSQLASHLDDYRDAVNSLHSGTSRPSYAVSGMIWQDTSSSPNPIKFFDGSDDIVIGYVDTSANTFRPANVFRGALVYKTATQVIETGAPGEAVLFASEYYDTDGFHDTVSNTSRLIVPAGTGITYVRLSAMIEWEGSNDGYRQIRLYKNGSAMTAPTIMIRDSAVGTNAHTQGFSTPPLPVTAGTDYFEIYVSHNAAAADLDINVTTTAGAAWFAIESVF